MFLETPLSGFDLMNFSMLNKGTAPPPRADPIGDFARSRRGF
jgi:hypothetical protein